MRIVPLTEADWQRARALRLHALKQAADTFGSTLAEEQAQPEAFWRARLAPTDRVTLIAERDGKDVGLAVCAPFEGSDTTAGLFSMWTAPAARRLGVGAALIEGAIAWARRRGYRDMALDVADRNGAAIALYSRMGFIPTGVGQSHMAPLRRLSLPLMPANAGISRHLRGDPGSRKRDRDDWVDGSFCGIDVP